MKIIQACGPPLATLPEGFVYVGQDCYVLTSPDAGSPQYLYSDSATSCVILMLEGAGRDHRPLVALAHLSCYERFRAFFELVDRHFCGAVNVFAIGANPPSARSSQHNSRMVLHWILTHTPLPEGGNMTRTNWQGCSILKTLMESTFRSGLHLGNVRTAVLRGGRLGRWTPRRTEQPCINWHIDQVTLALGLQVSEKARSGCAGIDLSAGIASTQAYILTEAQRDPTGGAQTLFSLFGLHTDPPILLHNSAEAFGEDEIARLVEQAERAHWTAILGMTDAQILASCSSTPDDEVPWFCEMLRTSARYVERYVQREA